MVLPNACSVLMHADNGSVDHLDSRIMGSGECIYDPAPDARPPPANETIVAGGVWTKVVWQVVTGPHEVARLEC